MEGSEERSSSQESEEKKISLLRLCERHGEECRVFCIQCHKPVCTQCTECGTHSLVSITRAISDKKSTLNSNSISRLKAWIEPVNEKKREELKQIEDKIERLLDKKKTLQKDIKKSKEEKDDDLALILNALESVKELRNRGKTDIFRAACINASNCFHVEKDMEEFVDNKELELLTTQTEINQLELKVIKLKKVLLSIEIINNKDCPEDVDSDDVLSSLILEDNIPPPATINISMSASDYVAFTGANQIIDRDLENVFAPIGFKPSISCLKYKKFDAIKVQGNNLFATVSHSGVFACYSETQNNVTLFDFNSYKTVDFKEANKVGIGFYNDKIVLVRFEKGLVETSVENILKLEKDKENIKWNLIGVGAIPHKFCYTHNAHTTRSIYFASADDKLYIYNVDNKSANNILNNNFLEFRDDNTLIKKPVQNSNFIFSGFGVGQQVNQVPANVMKNSINILEPQLAFSLSNNEPLVIKFIKELCNNSQYDASSISKPLELFDIQFQSCNSIIRIYHSIFLAYNENKQEWILARMTI